MKPVSVGSGGGTFQATKICEASWNMLANYAEYVKETVSRGAVPHNFEDWQYVYSV